jgi:amino acid transporter
MVLSTLVYIALIIIVIIVIVVLLRFLFNALFVMPVTLEHESIIRYATSLHLPT